MANKAALVALLVLVAVVAEYAIETIATHKAAAENDREMWLSDLHGNVTKLCETCRDNDTGCVARETSEFCEHFLIACTIFCSAQ